MAEYVFKLDEEAAKTEASSGGFGTLDTGIYKIKVNYVSLDKNNFGDNAVNVNLTTEDGHTTTVWGLGVEPKTGSGMENYDYPKWSQLQVLGEMKTGELVDYDIKKDDGTVLKTVKVFSELTGIDLVVAIQKVHYATKAGKVGDNNEFYQFFSAEGKTVSELKENQPVEKLNKIKTRLKDKETKSYKEFMANGGTPAQEEDEDDLF